MSQHKPSSGRGVGGHRPSSSPGHPRPSARAPAPPPAKKPAAKPSRPAARKVVPPGNGLLGWLGRQVGHVSKAVSADVTKPPAKPGTKPAVKPAARRPAQPSAKAARPPTAPVAAQPPAPPRPAPAEVGRVVYRTDRVEEIDLPDQPGVTLRRTIIDEVIVDAPKSAGPIPSDVT